MTKKQLQTHENFLAIDTMEDAMHEYMKKPCQYYDTKKQLRSCTAWVFTTDNYYILLSYGTYIACIEKATGAAYDVLRYVYGYTSTSAQHISKFIKDYGNGKCYTFRKV